MEKENGSPPLSLGHEIKGHSSIISRISWSDNGEYFAVSSYDNTLSIWRLEGYKLLWRLEGHTSPVLDVAWNKGANYIASCSGDCSVRIWKNSGVLTTIIEDFYGHITCLDWLGEDFLYMGSSVGIIYCYDLKENKLFSVIDTGHGSTNSINFSEDDKFLAIGSSNGYFSVYKSKNLEKEFFSSHVSNQINEITWSHNSKMFLSHAMIIQLKYLILKMNVKLVS